MNKYFLKKNGIKLIIAFIILSLFYNPSLVMAIDDVDFFIKQLKYVNTNEDENKEEREKNEIHIKKTATEQLAVLKSKKAVKPLIEALMDKYPDVRMAAAMALAEINDKSAVPDILKRLKKEKNVDVQVKLTLAVGKMKIKDAIPLLEKRLKHPNSIIQDATIEVLGDFGDKKPIADLLKVLKSKETDKQIRRSIILYLGKVGDKTHLPILEKISKDRTEDPIAIRNAAKSAIKDIKKRIKK